MNRQSFDLEKPNGKKQFLALLNALMDYNEDPDNSYFNDIHIKQEESFAVIEWDTVPYSGEWGGHWHFLEDDEVIMKEVHFPDGHYDYVFPEEVEETIKKWHEDHPEWVKTSYGTWTNMEENRYFSIDWNVDKWLEKEVDSEFDYMPQVPVGMSVSDYHTEVLIGMINHLKKDRFIHRTGYIVVGSKNLNIFAFNNLIIPQKEFNDSKVISKIGVLPLKLDEQKFSEDAETKYYEDDIHVYYSDKIGDKVLLLTDESYHLYTLKMTAIKGVQ